MLLKPVTHVGQITKGKYINYTSYLYWKIKLASIEYKMIDFYSESLFSKIISIVVLSIKCTFNFFFHYTCECVWATESYAINIILQIWNIHRPTYLPGWHLTTDFTMDSAHFLFLNVLSKYYKTNDCSFLILCMSLYWNWHCIHILIPLLFHISLLIWKYSLF